MFRKRTSATKILAPGLVVLALMAACEQQPQRGLRNTEPPGAQEAAGQSSVPPPVAPAPGVQPEEGGRSLDAAPDKQQGGPACTTTPEQDTTQQQVDVNAFTTMLARITGWVNAWFVNTQILGYADCTNVLVGVAQEHEMRRRVQAVLATNVQYATVAAFLGWCAAPDDAARAKAMDEMRATVTAQTWPFYMYAMYATPRETARRHLIAPDELLSRVFVPETLWDLALVQLGLFYRNCDSEGALIAYWDEIRKRRPALAGAAVVHQIAAAQRVNDGERVIAILRAGLDAVRKEPWAVERAISTLNAVSHPDVPALSNALIAPVQ